MTALAATTVLVPLTEPERVLAASCLLYVAATTGRDVEESQALATRLIEGETCSCVGVPDPDCPQHGDGLQVAA